MSLIAIGLLLLSAVLHAIWNLASKQSSPTTGFFLVANMTGVLITLPWFFFSRINPLDFPFAVWILLITTGFFQAVYFSFLSAAYRHGDMSVAYPIARALPVVIVPVVTIMLGRGGQLGVLFYMGAILVLAGGFLVSIETPSRNYPRTLIDTTCLLAAIAAIGTAGYSLADDQALRIIRIVFERDQGYITLTLLYLFLEAVLCCVWLTPIYLLSVRKTGYKIPVGRAIITGAGIYLTYGLVLLAMAHARDVSYVVAFRQVGILIGAGLGITILKESMHLLKLSGLVLLVAGLTLVTIG
jgi:drug/metabolite transporter (DMT)-like permease